MNKKADSLLTDSIYSCF